ncbi:unnamed protein product [Rotaria magnacalcarata]|uniref:Fibronectin type-III domain-containing protein n=7 Tax=Rotaria magnacalcarata TaxID=392030 RepID=A0A814YL33_9BILA|nr:unnamed protein product [Rotaria magnacalcarata]
MISGTSDSTVGVSVMTQLYKYYSTDGQFIPDSNVVFKKDLKSGHTFPADFDSAGIFSLESQISFTTSQAELKGIDNDIPTRNAPISSTCNCAFDGARAILEHIYGPLQPRNNGALSGKFIEFDQGEFIASAKVNGMSTSAWVYVPKSCTDGATCKLHVAYHGCVQSYEKIGDKFVKNTEYNRWADANNMIILYPQTVATTSISGGASLPNSNGCWDWIGWYGTDFSVNSGKQLAAMKKMIDRITGGFNPIDIPKELQVTAVTDNSVSLSWKQVSSAHGYNVYRNGGKVNGATMSGTTFTDSNLNSGSAYRFTVKAVLSSGSESSASNSATGKTTGESPAVGTPSGLIVTDTTSNSVTLKWDSVPGITTYNVYRNGNKVASVSVTSYTDTGLNSATDYQYQVSSVKDSVEGDKSMTVTTTTLAGSTGNDCYDESNVAHVAALRAYVSFGYTFALGSNQNMGLYSMLQKTNLCKEKDFYYVIA